MATCAGGKHNKELSYTNRARVVLPKCSSYGIYSEGSRPDHISSSFMAEALAMREAMQEAKRTSLLNVWFRTDSHELVRAINSK
ncbi:hypothetical protein YC2023_048136 [Brassica napus]